MIFKSVILLFLFFILIILFAELRSLIDKFKSHFQVEKLTIPDLKHILNFRGIDYGGLIEKREIIQIINETGRVTKAEFHDSQQAAENEGKCLKLSVKTIPNEDLFNELVEDTKDSAWILFTIFPKSMTPFSIENKKKLEKVWCFVQSVYEKFGVNMAELDCGKLYNLCWERGFHKSPFVLVLPRGLTRIKDSVDYFVYPYANNAVNDDVESFQYSVSNWLGKKLAHRVNRVASANPEKEFNYFYQTYPANFISIYLTKSQSNKMPSTSISAHSVKFTGRIYFSIWNINELPISLSTKISNSYLNWTAPTFFFLTKDKLLYQYGKNPGQAINFESLQIFFRHLCPSTNDIFIWNLIIINMIVTLQPAVQSGSIAVRLGYLLWYFIVFNLLYCFLFLFLISALNFSPLLSDFVQYLLKLWRYLAISAVFDHIRYLILTQRFCWSFIHMVWFVFVLFVGVIHRILYPSNASSINRTDVELTEHLQNDNNFNFNSNLNNNNNNRADEPWDPEAGQQIALLSSLGNFNLFLQQQPPLYISRLLIWSFKVPQKLASKWARRYKDSRIATTFNSFYDGSHSKTVETTDETELSSDISSNEANLGNSSTETYEKVPWPIGYIFTDQCCICLRKFRKNEILCGLPCGHAFHDECIKQWLVQWEKDDCPQCRWPAYKEKP